MFKIISKRFFSNSNPIFKFVPIQITSKIDAYNSLHLTVQKPIEQSKFKTCIQQAIKQTKKALWVHVQNQNLKYVHMLCNQYSFKIHHAKDQKIVLYKWLSPLSDLVAPYSMFIVSCGAIVIHNSKILLVQQKSGPRKKMFGIPGGRADFGQLLYECAERQLFQETRIKAKYKYVAYFRQLQKTYFGASDFYFACVMQAQQKDINNMKICNRQLSSYEWVHLSQVGDWMKEKSFGTQQLLAQYLQKMYKNGYDLNIKDNKLIPQQFRTVTFGVDGIQRRLIQHKLIKQIDSKINNLN